MIQTSYDPETDSFTVRFAPGEVIERTAEVAPGVALHFDADGQVIGIAVLTVRQRMTTGSAVDAHIPVEKLGDPA